VVHDDDFHRIEELSGTAELRNAVKEALGEISDEHRTALELRVVQERPYPEVARAMGVSEQVARARVSRALKKLKGVVESAAPAEVVEHA
jgi:RNA polymerase sigma factor (sigma-70 family)